MMKFSRPLMLALIGISIAAVPILAYAQPSSDIKQIYPKMYPAGGLEWKGETTQNTNWNKICEDKKGRIWFSGGDHWGTDRQGGRYEDRYERPWGYGNTTVCYYDPKTDKAYVAYELNSVSAIFSNAETPGHGKIHADIVCDADGNIWTGGYLGSSYSHEWTQQYYPKSYVGGAIIKYNPESKDVDYYGIPNPGGGLVSLKYDAKRNVVHGVTVERQRYYRLNIDSMELKRYDIARHSGREITADHEGNVWFFNEFNSFTKFDPDTETYTDFDTKMPGLLRASAVSKKGVIYGITAEGFVWSWDTKTNKYEEYGHVVGTPDTRVYTPNLCIDEQWGRLYFMAGGHGSTLAGMPILTVFDLKEKKFYWPGAVDVDGCYGSVVGKDHAVYFSCYFYAQKNGKRLKDKDGNEYRLPGLVRYDPSKNLEDFK
jgi:streptogramin lyase